MSNQTPDAVMIPDSWKGSGNAVEQCNSLVDHAEKALGVDRSSGERAWVRHTHGGKEASRFCTKSPEDTVYFPLQHPLEGQPRYRWNPQPDGSVHGFLVAEAKPKETPVAAD